MKVEFKEVQKFTQWWLWLILIGIGILPILGIYKQLILEEEFGSRPMSDTGIIVFSLFTFTLIALFLITRLKTRVDKNGIRMKFWPFVSKKVSWDEVKKIDVVDYGFVGGWGIRLWTDYGTVYNMKGKLGLAIELKTGKKFVIGTQEPEQMKLVIEKARVEAWI